MKLFHHKRKNTIANRVIVVFLLLGLCAGVLRFMRTPAKKVLADSFFKFDEGYGSSSNDLNQNVSSGTIANAVWRTDDLCFDGKCLYFDGTGDKVTFADDADLDFIASDSFTLEGWFRTPDITSGQRTIIAKHNATAGGYKVYMDSNGYVNFGVDDDSTWTPDDSVSTTTTAFDDNKWHHFAAVKTGTTSITLYVDGVQYQTDSSIAATGTLANADSFLIGIDGDGSSNGFSGFLDEIKVYRSARTAAEIKADFNSVTTTRGTAASFGPENSSLSNGLVGYWKMDESSWATNCSTASALDSSGNGFNAAPCPNASTPTLGVGKFGNGGVFDGVDDYLDIPTSTILASRNAFTISGWIKPTPSGSHADTVVGIGNGAEDILFGVDTNSTLMLYMGQWVNSINHSDSQVTSGVWQHVAVTYDGQSYSFYINGVLDGTGSWPVEDTGFNSSMVNIGGDSSSNEDYTGGLDEIRIYNKALTPMEIARLYSWTPGPVAYWKMDENNWTNNCSTSTVFDSSGNGNNGMSCPNTSGSTATAIGKFGNAGNFDGQDDYVEVNQSWKSNLKSFTTSLWVYMNSLNGTTNEQYHLYQRLTGDTSYPRLRIIGDGRISVQTSINATVDTTTTAAANAVVAGRWQHITVEYDNSASVVKIFLNGVLVKTGAVTAGTPDSGSGNMRLGKNGTTAGYLSGKLDEVKVYNYVRTSGQVVEDMNGGNPAPGSPVGSAVGHWRFDEGTDNTCSGGTNDVCNSGNGGNALDGAETGMQIPATAVSGWGNGGKYGKFLMFDGSNDNISIGDSALVEFVDGADMTLSFWVKSSLTSTGTILAKKTSTAAGTSGYDVRLSSSGQLDVYLSDGTDQYQLTKTSAITANVWTHVAVVYDEDSTTNTDMYINGVKQNATGTGTLSAVNDLGVNSSALKFGSESDDQDYFFGGLDDIKIFQTALTSDQIKSLYNQGAGIQFGSLGTDVSGMATNSASRSFCPPGDTTVLCAPIGYWNLDENTGTSARDTSSTGNAGTLTGGPTWVRGKVGQGVYFDGGDDYISVPYSASQDPTTDLTVSFWFKPNITIDPTNTSFRGLLSKASSNTDSENDWVFFWEDTEIGRMRFGTYGDNVQTTTSTWTRGTWYFITATVTSTNTAYIYVNGVRDNYGGDTSVSANAINGSTNTPLNIGLSKVASGDQYFNGVIDDVKIYNYARSAAEIAWDYNRGAPVGWWRMDDSVSGDAKTLQDASENNNDGTTHYGANTTGMDCTVSGKYGLGCSFDATDDYISMGDPAALRLTSVGSYTMWVNPNSYPVSGWKVLLNKGNWGPGRNYYAAYYVQSTSQLQLDVGGATGFNTIPLPNTRTPLSTWTHIAVTWDGTNVIAYINGKQEQPISQTQTPDTSGYNFEIGTAGASSSYVFDGKIDDVRVFNYPLTAQQVKTIMNEGSAIRFGQ